MFGRLKCFKSYGENPFINNGEGDGRGKGWSMFTGVITTKEVFMHPITLIREYGLQSFFRCLMKGLSKEHYQFLPVVLSLSATSVSSKTIKNSLQKS